VIAAARPRLRRRVRLTGPALRDVTEILERLRHSGAGQNAARTIRAIRAGIARLAIYPTIGVAHETRPQTRQHTVGLYRIIYTVEPNPDGAITVIRVLSPGMP
jgi:plasmid stabilization system protein ParE